MTRKSRLNGYYAMKDVPNNIELKEIRKKFGVIECKSSNEKFLEMRRKQEVIIIKR